MIVYLVNQDLSAHLSLLLKSDQNYKPKMLQMGSSEPIPETQCLRLAKCVYFVKLFVNKYTVAPIYKAIISTCFKTIRR